MDGGGSMPQQPDYNKLLAQQNQYNRQAFDTQTQASRPDINTPTGSSTWTNNRTFDQAGWDKANAERQAQIDEINKRYGTGDPNVSGRWVQTEPGGEGSTPQTVWIPGGGGDVAGARAELAKLDKLDESTYWKDNWVNEQKLSPEQQAAYDKRMELAGALSGKAGGIDTSVSKQELPDWAGPQYDATTGQRYTDQAMKAWSDRYEPQMKLEEQRLNDRLLQQGFNQTADAVGEQHNLLSQRQGDARTQALTQAMLTGDQLNTSEQNRAMTAARAAYDAGSQKAQFGASEQSRMGNEQSRLLSQALAQLTGQQAPVSGATTTATPGLQGVDYLGAANQSYQNLIGQYNAQQAAAGNQGAGLGGLIGGGAGLLLSGGNPYMGMMGASVGSGVGRSL